MNEETKRQPYSLSQFKTSLFSVVSPVLLLLGILFIGGLALIIGGFTILGWNNQASSLQNQYEMKVKANQGEFDNLWKKIKQSAQVPEQKKNAFKEIFTAYAGGRSAGTNQMMTWVKEAVPTTDLSIYDHLMNIITGSRDTWTMKQTELVSIAEQHNKLLVTQPQGFVLSLLGHKPINPTVITSARTEEAFTSGQDNDTSL